MEASIVTLKLLIDTKSKRVLFAEAGKEFVDFIVHILPLPIATIINLLNKQGMPGSLSSLYESIENLNETYIRKKQSKNLFLNPVPPASCPAIPLLKINNTSSTNQFYACHNCCSQNVYDYKFGSHKCFVYVTDETGVLCPRCNKTIAFEAEYVAPAKVEQRLTKGGLVKSAVTYMVMDNLVVQPMSSISSIALLNKFNVKDVGGLHEKEVSFGRDEALKLLGICLRSKKVLTDVFLNDI